MPSSKREISTEQQAPRLGLASASASAHVSLADRPVKAAEAFRFNGPVIRRYGYEIAGIFAIKLPLLLLLWFVVIRPWPHDPAVAADSVARSYSVTSQAAPHDD